MTAFARALDVVASSLQVEPALIVGPAKGAGVIPRARALVAYLASTEGEMTDTDIAKALKRDRSSVHHMLAVVEAIREVPEVDSWVDGIARQSINPPTPCPVTLQALTETHSERALDPMAAARRTRTKALPASAERALADLARLHSLTASQLLSRAAPVAIRHEAWATLHSTRTQHGGRYWTCRRIAELSGCTHTSVSRAVRQFTKASGGAS